jgi:hypothetical protein
MRLKNREDRKRKVKLFIKKKVSFKYLKVFNFLFQSSLKMVLIKSLFKVDKEGLQGGFKREKEG